MYASLADRSTRQLFKRLARLDELLIDEFGYLNLKPEQSNIFFKLIEERYRRHPCIITTNLGYDEWPNFLGNRPMVVPETLPSPNANNISDSRSPFKHRASWQEMEHRPYC
jgi:DNA replication protein DnaC